MKKVIFIKMRLAAPALIFALMYGNAALAQQTSPSPATPNPVSQTTAASAPNPQMTKADLKAQKKSQKQQEKAADANSKAAKSQAKAKKDQDRALQEQEKTVGTPPQN